MKKSARWVPAIALPVVVVAAAITVPAVAANAEVSLPEKTPLEVVTLAASSSGVAFSGTVEQSSDLGLPELPSSGAGAAGDDATSEALELLTGSHTAKVFSDGSTKQRVQVIEDLAERDVVRNGSEVWAYDSSKKEAVHTTLPSAAPGALPDGTALPQTPAEWATLLLSTVGPTTTVTADENVKVAGRAAYQVVLTPKDSTTLVRDAVLTVDAETGLPLKVVVDARGQDDPAVSVGFTSVDLATPASSVFDYTPSADTTVTEATPPTEGAGDAPSTDADHLTRTVVGTGWSTVVGLTPAAPTGDTVPAEGTTAPDGTRSGDASATLDQLTTAVDGGRVLQSSLLSVFLGDDGQVFVGAVDAATLQAAVAGSAVAGSSVAGK